MHLILIGLCLDDNSVLMQKVASELLLKFKPSKLSFLTHYMPRILTRPSVDLASRTRLHGLLEAREKLLLTELAVRMLRAGKKGRYDTWMYKEQDLVQQAARAYGDRLISQLFRDSITTAADPSLKPILGKLHHLYLLTVAEKNLGQLIYSGLMPPRVAAKVSSASTELCREIAPESLALCEAFGLSEKMLSAPIARDWVKYNEVDNRGEIKGLEF